MNWMEFKVLTVLFATLFPLCDVPRMQHKYQTCSARSTQKERKKREGGRKTKFLTTNKIPCRLGRPFWKCVLNRPIGEQFIDTSFQIALHAQLNSTHRHIYYSSKNLLKTCFVLQKLLQKTCYLGFTTNTNFQRKYIIV